MIEELNPYIRHAGGSVLPPRFRIGRRIIFDFEIICVMRGNLTLTVEEKPYLCRAGDVILLHPGRHHSFDVGEEGVEQPHIHFDLCYDVFSAEIPICFRPRERLRPEELRWIRRDDLAAISEPLLRVSDRSRFLDAFFGVVRAKEEGGEDSLLLKIRMLELLRLVLADNAPALLRPSILPRDVIEMVKAYMDESSRARLSLAALEAQFNYSRFYLERRFKERYGISIMQYAARLRLDNAKRMLTDRSVTEVARALGYTSIYSFSRAFKNRFGCSPSKTPGRHPADIAAGTAADKAADKSADTAAGTVADKDADKSADTAADKAADTAPGGARREPADGR